MSDCFQVSDDRLDGWWIRVGGVGGEKVKAIIRALIQYRFTE